MPTTLITLADPASPAAEAYRSLRVNLTAADRAAPLHVILMVAAAAPAPDKAAAVANLAITFARAGKRVILADGDLHAPAQHTLFGLENRAGLTDALNAASGPLPLQESGVPGLRVLTSGPVSGVPADLIAGPAMGVLLGRLREAADIVLLDAPPVLQTTDAAELAPQVDGVLLLVQAGRTKRAEAQRARDLLTRIGARIIGAALVNTAQ